MARASPEVLATLRERYLERSAERLSNIESALDRLEIDSSDRPAIDALLRAFDGFAGSGETYGSEQITLLGHEGEALLQRVIVEGHPIRPDQYRRLRELADLLRERVHRITFDAADADLTSIGSFVPRRRSAERLKAVLVGERSSATRIRQALENAGMTVSSAESAEKGSELIRREIPNVLITDVALGDSSGYELVAQVRERADGDRTAAFVVSPHEGFLDKVEAIRCGADGSFQEPVDEGAVVRRVNMTLERLAQESGTILLVESEPDQAEYIRVVLESAGYEVVICGDPREFEHALSRHQPDLLLMDIVLPDVSGYEIARYVRQDEAHAALPILFLTTGGHSEAAVESIRSGADDVLFKPVSPRMLVTSVAARIERARMLTHLLERDGLTGLLTHTAFIERLTVAHKEQSRGSRRSTALVMLDIDHFKRVNDRHGHPAGDRVLASLAGYLRRRLRQTDTLGRYGGEEFGILLHDLDPSEAKMLFERMLEEFSKIEHPVSPTESVNIEFSVGIAMLDVERMPEVNRWIEAADSALYRAKEKGRRRIEMAE